MITHRDRESLAEEWQQLLSSIDTHHPRQAAVPIAAEVDAFTIAYAILLIKEGASDPHREKEILDLSRASQFKTQSCCAAAQGLDMAQLETLIVSATGRLRETGSRPLSANPQFHGMTHTDRFAILSSMYGQTPKKPASRRRPTTATRVSLGRHLGDVKTEEVILVPPKAPKAPVEMITRFSQTELSTHQPKPAAKTILSSESTVRRTQYEVDSELTAGLLGKAGFSGVPVKVVAKFLVDSDQCLEAILQLSNNARAALDGPMAAQWVTTLEAAASSASTSGSIISLPPRAPKDAGSSPLGHSVGHLVERVGARISEAAWISHPIMDDPAVILGSTSHNDRESLREAIEAQKATLRCIMQPRLRLALPSTAEVSMAIGPADDAGTTSSDQMEPGPNRSILKPLVPLLKLLQGASSRLSAGLAGAYSIALVKEEGSWGAHSPAGRTFDSQLTHAAEALDDCQSILEALDSALASAALNDGSKPWYEGKRSSPAMDLFVQLREAQPAAVIKGLGGLLRSIQAVRDAKVLEGEGAHQAELAAVLDSLKHLRSGISDLADLTSAAELMVARAAEPLGGLVPPCQPSISTLPALSSHLSDLADALDVMHNAESLTGKLHPAALVPLLQGLGLGTAVTLDSWGAVCNSAWEAIRTHAAFEAMASNALPSYADLLSQLSQLKQADDLRRQMEGERDDLQSQLAAALKQLAESQQNDTKAKADLLVAHRNLTVKDAALTEAQKKLEDAMKAIEDLKAKLASKPTPTVVPEKKGCCS